MNIDKFKSPEDKWKFLVSQKKNHFKCHCIRHIDDDEVETLIQAERARFSIIEKYNTDNEGHKHIHSCDGVLTGKGIRVAILDSGMDINHNFIDKSRVTRHDLLNEKKDLAKDETSDKHGTTLAGIIGANIKPAEGNESLQGIAPGCYLHIMKCFDKNGTAKWPKIKEALNKVKNFNLHNPCDKIRVVLLAVEEREGRYSADFLPHENDSIARIIRELRESGVIIVASSGNNHDGKPSMSYPAILKDDVISVGAIYAKSPGGKNWNGKPTQNCQLIPNVTTLLAPGWGVKSLPPDWDKESPLPDMESTLKGTSVAAAIVAGAVVLVLELYEKIYHRAPDFHEVKNILQRNPEKVKDDVRKGNTNAEYETLDIYSILSKI